MSSSDLEVSHLSGYMGVTEKIKRAMYDVAKQFVYIGFLLWEVQEYGYYHEAGYQDVYEYAAKELGFKKSSVKNFIAISYQFGTADHRAINGAAHVRTMSLQQPYEKFQYSQLCEMLSMSEKQRELVTPDMTVKQIRQLKKELKGEKPEPVKEASSQTSGSKNQQIACTVNNIWSDLDKQDVKDLCFMTGKRYNTKSNYRIQIKAIPRNQTRLEIKERLCKACHIEFDPANFDYGITVELIEK